MKHANERVSMNSNAERLLQKSLQLLLGAAVITMFAFVARPATAQDSGAYEDDTLDEIIVRGRKRAESLQNVPSSVSVIDGEDFERLGGRNLRDIEFQLANVDFFDQSNLVNNIVSIRGIGTNTRSAGLETGTAYYLDGVLLNRPGLFALTTNDLQNIEVFRGPQGTEFGRNALAGVFLRDFGEADRQLDVPRHGRFRKL